MSLDECFREDLRAIKSTNDFFAALLTLSASNSFMLSTVVIFISNALIEIAMEFNNLLSLGCRLEDEVAQFV